MWGQLTDVFGHIGSEFLVCAFSFFFPSEMSEVSYRGRARGAAGQAWEVMLVRVRHCHTMGCVGQNA